MDGDNIYGDFTISGATATQVRSLEPGMRKFEWMDDGFGEQVPDDTTVAYYHTNQIGTTRLMTDASGAPTGQVAFTAFGEQISGANHRYGYAGMHGYESHDFPSSDPIPYLHVGHRYYDPATGRFLQRDPIGIRGGLNVYAYVRNAPTIRIDPDGLWWWGGAISGGAIGAAVGAKGNAYTFVACIIAGFIMGGLERGDLDFLTPRSSGPPPRGKCMRGCHSNF